MKVLCYCKRFIIETEDAAYVKDGVPMCAKHVCDQANLNDARNLRRVPLFDDIENDGG